MPVLNPHDSTTWPIGYRRIPYNERELCPMNEAQDKALRAVFDRQALTLTAGRFENLPIEDQRSQRKLTFGEFRASVEMGSGCVMVYWCGMWLGIEPDGYTHS